jgi:hypothetical protein
MPALRQSMRWLAWLRTTQWRYRSALHTVSSCPTLSARFRHRASWQLQMLT